MKTKRHTWLWNPELITSLESKNEILRFCRLNHVDVIYLQYSIHISPTYYYDFIREATRIGIEVHAAIGEREWYKPENYHTMHNRLLEIQYHNSFCAYDEVFTGVHIDIEPHTLDEWKAGDESREQVVQDWVGVMETYSLFVRKDLGLELSAAIPIAYKSVASPTAFAQNILRLHDKVVIMAYRDFVQGNDGIIYHCGLMFNAAAMLPDVSDCIVIAVETKPVEPEKLTFAEEGLQIMYQTLNELDNYYVRNYPELYAGHGIHSLDYWPQTDYIGGTSNV